MTLKKKFVKEFSDSFVMLHSGICSDPQMALRTDHFVDRTFRGSN